MELKERRMVMFKEDGAKGYKFSVRFHLDGKDYYVPLYANLTPDETIYYGGTILDKREE